MANEVLLNLAAEIVTAHVSNNSVAAGELPGLIQSIYGSLAGLGQEPEVEPVKQEPAVSIRSSVKPDAIACLECGAKMKMLKRHLGTNHALTPAEYRAKWRLAADYPMIAADYAATRKELALKIGLGRKPVQKVAKRPAAKPKMATTAKPKTAMAKPKTAPVKPKTPPANPETPAAKPRIRSRKPAPAATEAG